MYSHYWPEAERGGLVRGMPNQDLQRLTFDDDSFDVVITQDVFEHVPDPAAALREVARVLVPGGRHVWTVPIHARPVTVVRAEVVDGVLRHLCEPEYHGNPVDANGALVFREWGGDIVDFVLSSSGMVTERVAGTRPELGIEGDFLDVLVSRKA